MGKFILRRLLQAIPTVFGIMLITFLITRLSPSDPVSLMLAGNFDITAEDREALRESLGLNDPLPVQFIRWAADVLTLDFGTSFYYHRPVFSLLLERIPNSLQYAVLGLLLALAVGVPLGILAALTRGRWPDHVVRVTSVVLNATPDFFLGLLFILFFAIQLRWFPIGSMNAVGQNCGLCGDRLWHLVGPALLAANGGIALYPRILRTELLEILSQDYVRTARSKGLRERVVILGHVLRNALIPIVTIFGGILTIVLSGSLITETVFNWPGFGRLGFEAAVNKDYPIVQAVVLLGGILLLLSYILRDIAYAWVDPRIKVR